MRKKLHLISNAHLDPVWQWEWEEGCAAAISTFRCAARFCREFDSYIFCHNESLLYRWVEEYDPDLFREIRDLVREGRWHIMGGWHVQPDCNMPSGEALARQITEGRRYFKEKFGIEPTTAINFDPFGHSRGLVQLLAKSGYDSYLFCRPDPASCPLPAETFRWVGYDGSEVIAQRSAAGYGTGLGHALDKIRPTADSLNDHAPLGFCLWGVGNHGGGPSRQDIQAIQVFTEQARQMGVEMVHSTPEAYFADVKAQEAAGERTLPAYAKDLNSWAPGCYTSQVRIKQKYRETENSLFSTEKAVMHAFSLGAMDYPEAELGQALYDMLTVQFHDILPGSSVQPAEEAALRMLDHALEILSRIRMRAFLALTEGQAEAAEGEIPVLVYNPHPWPVEDDFECEFMLADQNWSDSFTVPHVFRDGEPLSSQCEKEHSNIPLDWRKRVVFHTTLAPMSINRFDCRLESVGKKPVPDMASLAGTDPDVLHLAVSGGTVDMNRRTGHIISWWVGGVNYLADGAGALDVMEDANDSWGMTRHSWRDKVGEFTLLSETEGVRFSDLDTPIPSIRLIEDGEVRAVVEAVFGYQDSRAVVRYRLSKTAPRIDMDIRIVNATKRRMIKLRLPQALAQPTPALEVAFGEEPMRPDGWECVGQKYLTVTSEDGHRLSVLNRGIYGSSFDGGTVYLTLLHSPGYTAHPLGDRPVMPTDRHSEHMEQGERSFLIRLVAGQAADRTVAREALSFNEVPTVLNVFPSGQHSQKPAPAEISFLTLNETPITMTALKRTEDGRDVLLRLFNPTDTPAECTVFCPLMDLSAALTFSPYELRTFRIHAGRLMACRVDDT